MTIELIKLIYEYLRKVIRWVRLHTPPLPGHFEGEGSGLSSVLNIRSHFGSNRTMLMDSTHAGLTFDIRLSPLTTSTGMYE